jgi:hypothetical protein
LVSTFICRELGLGPELTDEHLLAINRLRVGKEYDSKEDATSLFGTAEKRPIRRGHFDNNLVDSPFLKMFRYGQAHDGYWTHQHMKIQIEDLVNALKVVFPNFDFLLLFDQSSGHTKKREDGLNAINMNREHGRRVPKMRQTILDANCLGQHSPSIDAGETQELVYEMTANFPEDGPFYLSVEERIRRRHDIILPLTKTEKKLAVELKAEFVASNIPLPPRPSIKKLRALAKANNILTTKTVDNRVHRNKTMEELKEELAATGLCFEHRNYRLLMGSSVARDDQSQIQDVTHEVPMTH